MTAWRPSGGSSPLPSPPLATALVLCHAVLWMPLPLSAFGAAPRLAEHMHVAPACLPAWLLGAGRRHEWGDGGEGGGSDADSDWLGGSDEEDDDEAQDRSFKIVHDMPWFNADRFSRWGRGPQAAGRKPAAANRFGGGPDGGGDGPLLLSGLGAAAVPEEDRTAGPLSPWAAARRQLGLGAVPRQLPCRCAQSL